MSEWRQTTLGALVAESNGSIQTGPFGSQLHASDYVSDGVPSVMPANIGENVIVEDGIVRVSEDDAVRLDRHRVAPGDILYARRGDVEKRALIRAENAGWLCGTGCLRVRFGNSQTDSTFISYALGTEWTREWIVQHAVGATMPNLNTSILSDVPLMVPSLVEQRAIATVLSALDDKIAANTKLAAVADSLALTLASRFAPSVPLGEVVTRSNEAVDPTRLQDDRVLHYSLPAFDAGQVPAAGDPRSIKSNKFAIPGPSVLVSKLNPRFPRVWNVAHPGAGRALASTEYVVLTSDHCSPSVLWSLVAQPSFGAQLEGMVAGTSGSHQRVKPAEMLAVRIPDPRNIPDEEHRTIEGLALRAIAAREESQCLAALRDVLLPALMSGRRTVRSGDAVAGLADSGSITQPDVALAGTLW